MAPPAGALTTEPVGRGTCSLPERPFCSRLCLFLPKCRVRVGTVLWKEHEGPRALTCFGRRRVPGPPAIVWKAWCPRPDGWTFVFLRGSPQTFERTPAPSQSSRRELRSDGGHPGCGGDSGSRYGATSMRQRAPPAYLSQCPRNPVESQIVPILQIGKLRFFSSAGAHKAQGMEPLTP